MGKTLVIITGHGRFADGMLDPLRMLSGIPDNFRGVEFPAGMAEEELEERIGALVDREREAEGGEGIGCEIFLLTDVAGGTPFNMSVKLSMMRPGITVMTGVNLPLVLQIAMMCSADMDIGEQLEQMVCESRDALQIVHF